MVTTKLALSPTLNFTSENLTGGSGLNVNAPSISQHCGDNLQVITSYLSLAIPQLIPVGVCVCGGGGWIQMTGA